MTLTSAIPGIARPGLTVPGLLVPAAGGRGKVTAADTPVGSVIAAEPLRPTN